MKHYPHPKGVKLDNLLKMADYIENVPEHKFSMIQYRSQSKDKHNCETVGCILGHCTILDDFNNIPLSGLYGTIDFESWCFIFTGISVVRHINMWQYLFSAEWAKTDNTPKGSAKRIIYFVKNGLPENWVAQMTGKEPLSYNQ